MGKHCKHKKCCKCKGCPGPRGRTGATGPTGTFSQNYVDAFIGENGQTIVPGLPGTIIEFTTEEISGWTLSSLTNFNTPTNGFYYVSFIAATQVSNIDPGTVYPVRLEIFVNGFQVREVTKSFIEGDPSGNSDEVIPLHGILPLATGDVVTFLIRVNNTNVVALAKPATRVVLFQLV